MIKDFEKIYGQELTDKLTKMLEKQGVKNITVVDLLNTLVLHVSENNIPTGNSINPQLSGRYFLHPTAGWSLLCHDLKELHTYKVYLQSKGVFNKSLPDLATIKKAYPRFFDIYGAVFMESVLQYITLEDGETLPSFEQLYIAIRDYVSHSRCYHRVCVVWFSDLEEYKRSLSKGDPKHVIGINISEILCEGLYVNAADDKWRYIPETAYEIDEYWELLRDNGLLMD